MELQEFHQSSFLSLIQQNSPNKEHEAETQLPDVKTLLQPDIRFEIRQYNEH